MNEIICTVVVPVAVTDAFAYVTDPAHWPQFVVGTERAEPLQGWGAAGGTARATARLLGRPLTVTVEILEWDPPGRFRYLMARPGRSDLDSTRLFSAVAAGTKIVAITRMPHRSGSRRLLDRLDRVVVRRRTERSLRNLVRVLGGP